MQIKRKHNVPPKRAREMVEAFIPKLVEQYGDYVSNTSYSWCGSILSFAFKARGFNICGEIALTENEVVLDVGMPLLLRPFEGTIRPKVISAMDEVFRS